MCMLMLMGIFLGICMVMCKKILHSVRSTSGERERGRGGGRDSYLLRVLTNLANTSYVGNAVERERFRSTLHLMRREITPDDYETLLALDAAENFTRPREGVSQSLIDRCPIMTLTKTHIEKMSGGSDKEQSKIDQLPLAASEEANDSTQSPLNSLDEYSCTVCLGEYRCGDKVRTLPCMHQYHMTCIDPWLLENGNCPMCKQRIDNGNNV